MSKINTVRTSVASNTHTIPFNEEVKLHWIHVVYTSDATVGNRRLQMQLLKGSDVYNDAHAGAVQAASLVYDYNFKQGIFRETSFIDNEIEVPLPKDFIIQGNFSLKIFDKEGVSGSDSMIISYQYSTI